MIVKNLLDIQMNGTAPMREKATKDFQTLRANMTEDLTKMGAEAKTKANDLKTDIANGTSGAAKAGASNLTKFADAVSRAMANGSIAASTGAQLIEDALNATLVAFGGTKIPNLGVKQAGTIVGLINKGMSPVAAAFSQTNPYGAAGGALMQIGRPGDKGHDNIPLNVGGIPVLVGSGEQVAVLNASQQQYLNQRLAPEGGLPGFFQRVNKPHYMSSGGLVPRHAAAGSLVTASDFTAYPTASGRNHIPGFAELSHNYGAGAGGDFSALGHLPMGTMVSVNYGGHTITIPKIDVGAGGPPLPPATLRAIDLSMEAARELPGFPGLANVMVNIGNLGSGCGRDMDRSQGSHRDRQGRGCRHRPGGARTRSKGRERVRSQTGRRRIPHRRNGHPPRRRQPAADHERDDRCRAAHRRPPLHLRWRPRILGISRIRLLRSRLLHPARRRTTRQPDGHDCARELGAAGRREVCDRRCSRRRRNERSHDDELFREVLRVGRVGRRPALG